MFVVRQRPRHGASEALREAESSHHLIGEAFALTYIVLRVESPAAG